MTDLYNEAIIHNNKGATLFVKGEYANARAEFRKATIMIKGSRKQQHELLLDSAAGTADESLSFAPAFRWSSSAPLRDEQPHIDLSAGSSFVYRRALLIVPAAYYHGTHDCYLETAAMLYNLGLSLHLEGHLRNSSTMMDKAMEAYNVSLIFRRRQKFCSKIERDRLVDIAINNNLAMIHQEFMEFDKARCRFAKIYRDLQCLGNSDLLKQKEYQGLVLNIMMGRQNQNTLAPAA